MMGNCSSGGGTSVTELTMTEKVDITESWFEFSKGDIVDNGAPMFFKLFRDHPGTKDLFGFAKDSEESEEEMLKSPQFRGHVKKVFGVVEAAVRALDDLTVIENDLTELGARHYYYKVTVKQYSLVGQCLLYALERKLGPSFTADRRKAWATLFSVVEYDMKAGMQEESRNSRENK